MQIRIITGTLLLFCFQLYLVLSGAPVFTKYINPLLLLLTAIAIGWLYLYVHASRLALRQPAVMWKKTTAVVITMVIILTLLGISLGRAYYDLPDPGTYSDVNPQLEMLFTRFCRGEQPYYPVVLNGHAPFPVYMPLHWLPIGLARLLAIDARWTSFILLAPVIFVYGWMNRGNLWSVIMVLLPVVVIFSYLWWDQRDLTVTMELVVAAYYLLLTAGLDGNNYWSITIGIISCMLSRYTLIFWLPMLAVLLWRYEPARRSFRLWGITAAGILIFYVLPFLAREPSILKKGILYHNYAAVGDWKGGGSPPISWSHEDGVSFGGVLKALLPGDAEGQVMYVRVIQAGLMLALMIGGICCYKKVRTRISVPRYSVALLFFFMTAFYLFSPLTYKYYWLSLLMVSAVMCGSIIGKTGYFIRKGMT